MMGLPVDTPAEFTRLSHPFDANSWEELSRALGFQPARHGYFPAANLIVKSPSRCWWRAEPDGSITLRLAMVGVRDGCDVVETAEVRYRGDYSITVEAAIQSR
jgi:hypothetical protein